MGETQTKTKMNFDLEFPAAGIPLSGKVSIIGERPKADPYLHILVSTPDASIVACVSDKDLRLLAVNILKSLKSKRLKS